MRLTGARFAGEIVVEQDGPWWIVMVPFAFEEYEDPNKYQLATRIVVPEGFVTDFASTPRLLWWFMPPTNSAYSAAAVVHDRLYEKHDMTRADADAVFYRAMAVNGTPPWERYIMWLAVRLFGRRAYRSGPQRQRGRLAEHRYRMRRRTLKSVLKRRG